MLCRDVPFCTVLCCAFSLVHTRRQRYQADRVGESQSVLEHFIIGEPSLSFFGLRGNCLYYTGIQQQPDHASYEYVFVEYLQQYREHSTAQRSHPCTKRHTKYVPIGVNNRINMYVPSCGVRVCWRMELLAFANCLFKPKMFDHLIHVIPFHSSL